MKMKIIINRLLILVVMVLQGNINAQNTEIIVWESGVPNAIDAVDYKENHDVKLDRVSQVTEPTLTVFKPKNPNGTSVVIFPGGGYAYLAISKEGYKVAEWLNTLGITAFVLKYRLPSDAIMEDKSIGPLQDAQEALRHIRRNSKEWKLDADKIGVIGFSAGGHLAATLSTRFDDEVYKVSDNTSAKPNFSLLIYPVISMMDDITHKGSRNKLLGKSPTEETKIKFSGEKQISTKIPPTFLAHAIDDKGVVVENSLQYLLALKQNQIPAELHVYQNGGHGFGLGKVETSDTWTIQCEAWLRLNKFIKQ
jgi:acetyl esterase/lipase